MKCQRTNNTFAIHTSQRNDQKLQKSYFLANARQDKELNNK